MGAVRGCSRGLHCPLSSLTPWLFLVPVFGLLIGIVGLGERPGAWTVAGIVLVLVSTRAALTSSGTGTHTGAAPGHLHLAGGAVPTGPSSLGRPLHARAHTRRYGEDDPAIRDWTWPQP
jgi:hypothetical protein